MGRRKILESAESRMLPLIQFEGADVGHEWPTRLFLAFLGALSRCNLLGVRVRMLLYRYGILKRHPLGSRIIRVGNVVAGGTGKTPMVEALARELSARGRKVAILSRGYRSKRLSADQQQRSAAEQKSKHPIRIVSRGDGRGALLQSDVSGDEPFMLASNLPDVAVLVDSDRLATGRYAVQELGCDTLLLDDGFQHLRLQDGIDMVLVDCTNPFGNGNLIPRGILREPASEIRRARFICITKAKGRDTQALRQRLRALNPTAGILECSHEPRLLRNAFTREALPLEWLEGRRLYAVSGIASPGGFERSLVEMGATLAGTRHFADHHRYSAEEIDEMARTAAGLGVDAVLTTEKDAVRMSPPADPAIPFLFLRIEMTILKGQDVFESCLREITNQTR